MGLSFCNVLTSVSMIYVGGLGRLVRSSLEETVWCGFTFSYVKSQGTITKAPPSRRANMNIDYLCCESYSQMMYIKCYIFAAVTCNETPIKCEWKSFFLYLTKKLQSHKKEFTMYLLWTANRREFSLSSILPYVCNNKFCVYRFCIQCSVKLFCWDI